MVRLVFWESGFVVARADWPRFVVLESGLWEWSFVVLLVDWLRCVVLDGRNNTIEYFSSMSPLVCVSLFSNGGIICFICEVT